MHFKGEVNLLKPAPQPVYESAIAEAPPHLHPDYHQSLDTPYQ